MVKFNTDPEDGSTIFHYRTYSEGQVRIHILDSSGRLIEELLNSFEEAGDHSVIWSTSNLKPGVYLYSIKSPGGRSTGTILLPIPGKLY